MKDKIPGILIQDPVAIWTYYWCYNKYKKVSDAVISVWVIRVLIIIGIVSIIGMLMWSPANVVRNATIKAGNLKIVDKAWDTNW